MFLINKNQSRKIMYRLNSPYVSRANIPFATLNYLSDAIRDSNTKIVKFAVGISSRRKYIRNEKYVSPALCKYVIL